LSCGIACTWNPLPSDDTGVLGAETTKGDELKMEKVQFATNTPETIALKYPTGKSVTSQIDGSEQLMFTLTDGRVMFLYPQVAEKISTLGLKPGEQFVMCKREVRNGESARTPGVWWIAAGSLE
jgi:hypothetical protein